MTQEDTQEITEEGGWCDVYAMLTLPLLSNSSLNPTRIQLVTRSKL